MAIVAGSDRSVRRQEPAGHHRLDVEPEHAGVHQVEAALGPVGTQGAEVDALGDRLVRRPVAERLDAEQGCPGVDLNVGGDEHVPNPSAHGRGDGELHLHRLDDGHPGPGLDHVVSRHVDARRRGRRPEP